MISVNNLTLKVIKTSIPLINQLNFTLNHGDKIAVIGHEGTGKSTLLKYLYDASTLDFIEKTSGEINIQGQIGYLEQDIHTRWGHVDTISYFLKDTPDSEINDMRYETLKSLAWALEEVDFKASDFIDTKPLHQYSGGEIVKLALAKLLLEDNDILFLDEPTNDLDFDAILFLEKFITNTDKAVLFVSHDERLLEHTANAVIHLQRTHKRKEAISYFERMPYEDYREYRLNQYQSLRMNALKERKDYQDKMKRFRQIYQKVEHQQNQAVRNPSLARLLKKKMKHLKGQEKRYEKEKDQMTPMPESEIPIEIFFDKSIEVPSQKLILDLKDYRLKRNDTVLSQPINLLLKGPQKIVIIGKNGIGKTTFLNTIKPLIEAKDLSVGFMPQSFDVLESAQTVLEFLNVTHAPKEEADVRKILGTLAFEREEMTTATKNLSGGQKAKLLILKMMINKNNVLILDEPTRNLSPLSAPEIREMLKLYKGTIIAVSHDRAFIEEVFDDMYELKSDGLYKDDRYQQ